MIFLPLLATSKQLFFFTLGSILILWNPNTILVDDLDFYPRYIHCIVTYRITRITLFENHKWRLVIGDFNNIFKHPPFGLQDPWSYSLSFKHGFQISSLGCYFTWTNKSVLLDRVWWMKLCGLQYYRLAGVGGIPPPGRIYDRNPCFVSLPPREE